MVTHTFSGDRHRYVVRGVRRDGSTVAGVPIGTRAEIAAMIEDMYQGGHLSLTVTLDGVEVGGIHSPRGRRKRWARLSG